VQDWIVVRKAKSAGAITQTVIAALTREAVKAGISVEDAVRFCAEAGWQGFRADWYERRISTSAAGSAPGNKQQALENRNRATAESWLSKEKFI
jgi:hypothetical protein